jgi:mannose-6-phosphate isomerase-like protein (cupin superfamily)
MSNFTIVNMQDVEPSEMAQKAGIEGRFARKHMESRDLGVSLWRYPPNFKAGQGHSHREQEEAYLVIGGSGRILLGNEAREIGRWDLITVSPELPRAFAAGPEGLELVAVGGPKPPEGDGVMAEVSWPD